MRWALLAVLAAAPAAALPKAERRAETALRDWPAPSRGVAEAMIKEYGEPDRFNRSMLVWNDNGDWKRSVVYRGPRPGGILEQTINYVVPDEKVSALERFDKRLRFDFAAGELSARSGSEKENYLILNLAEEIIDDKRGVEDSREFEAETEALLASGKPSPYLDGFRFSMDDDDLVLPDPSDPSVR